MTDELQLQRFRAHVEVPIGKVARRDVERVLLTERLGGARTPRAVTLAIDEIERVITFLTRARDRALQRRARRSRT